MFIVKKEAVEEAARIIAEAIGPVVGSGTFIDGHEDWSILGQAYIDAIRLPLWRQLMRSAYAKEHEDE